MQVKTEGLHTEFSSRDKIHVINIDPGSFIPQASLLAPKNVQIKEIYFSPVKAMKLKVGGKDYNSPIYIMRWLDPISIGYKP